MFTYSATSSRQEPLLCAWKLKLIDDFIQHMNDGQKAFSLSLTLSLQKCTPSVGEDVRCMGEVIKQVLLCMLCFSPWCRNGKVDKYYQRSTAFNTHIMTMGKTFFFHCCSVHCIDWSTAPQFLTSRKRWHILQNTGQWTKLKRSAIVEIDFILFALACC